MPLGGHFYTAANSRIQIGLADDQGYIQEIWRYIQGWKIQELCISKIKVAAE